MSLMGGGFIGWGKPVNTNPAKIRGGWNGVAVVAMAGPVSNVVFAVILAIVRGGSSPRSRPASARYAARGCLSEPLPGDFQYDPIPPLDGSKLLLAARIPPFIYRELAQFGFILCSCW